jgi:hypothetical protein
MAENTQLFTFTLEIQPEDTSDADPALASALGRDVADIFREQGETVRPVYTGERGGEFLVEITTLLTRAWANKEIILSDFSALVSILTPLVLASRSLWKAYERRVGKDLAQQKPLTITLDFHGTTLKVEAMAQQDAVTVATELARQFQAHQSEISAQVLAPTAPKIRASVPKRPARKRR